MSVQRWVAAGAVVLVVVAAVAVTAWWRRSRRAESAGTTAPRRGEVWWADVPYEDVVGSKDRPCLVVSVRSRTARVVKITSRFHEELPGIVALPAGTVDDAEGRRSYLETRELRTVPLSAFRRRAGSLDQRAMKSLGLR
ncbi:type II toxin-antitoxin system PemK/MazF family toxin [Actinacidiphila paucisporea]|uniref:mRNA-degrading endonuclease, toxin component of the MazEF toxin-antitoxin module n=1 Tax=Actinacidiphila paucisporea TaxID=310782 RepID=A0A1M7PED3_9ACTN|nr:type II toxin-antitoxin system PemK/MazF family toxin [Actinacidiphila paucisporea]SHN15413.1 mRNA-degrading endonuclease, toxin component of the MazEF toxin-antitoxin module [Actinacidiphila paucisporea]